MTSAGGQQGRCVSCGFLGKRDDRTQTGNRYTGAFELEEFERANPTSACHGVHGAANVYLPMEMFCFRNVVSIPNDIATVAAAKAIGVDAAAKAVLNKERNCSQWFRYEPGHDPKEHLMERRLYELESDRKVYQLFLTRHGRWIAIAALILALAQVMTMTHDSMLYRFSAYLYHLAVPVKPPPPVPPLSGV